MFAKTFRNTLVASTLLIGASLFTGLAANAAPDNPSVNTEASTVGGTVELINRVSFSAASTGGVVVGVDGVASRNFGTLSIQNNSASGWKLNVASSQGRLQRVDGTIDQFLTYEDLTVAEITGASQTSALLDITPIAKTGQLVTGPFSSTIAAGVSGVALTAKIPNAQHVPAGVYSDTLTFTLANN